MIIISQDKELIINFDSVRAIDCGAHYKDENFGIRVFMIGISHEAPILGVYSSKERAMSVIEKIANAVSMNMPTYQMPKK